MSKNVAKVGVIGCGAISSIYLRNSKNFDAFDIVAVADMRIDAAQARADEFEIAKACSVDELLADPEIELVINITPHHAHGKVAIAVLESGKSVYNEKPMAVHLEDGQKMLQIAKEKDLRVGCAPDTFFGGAWQTARKLIDDGTIGRPVASSICLMQLWKPSHNMPKSTAENYINFYRTDFFEFGVTWIFDRGPYYLNAIIHLLGPIRRVTGSAKNTWGDEFSEICKTPTHFAGVMDFANGSVGTLLITSDVHSMGLPHVEIYGTEGSIRCINPNNFGGPIFLRSANSGELEKVECEFGYNHNSRGVGVADMATAIRNDRPHRASGEMGYHVIEIVHALHTASSENRHVELASSCDQPAALPIGLEEWTIDD